MAKYFGTDGFRGEVGVALTAEHAYKTGRFLGWHYQRVNGPRVRIAIGKDTRRSSYMLEYALAAGVTASGADAYMLHVTTTPSVSYVTASEQLDCGVMISASHNVYSDNGIKIVNARGEKMDDRTIEWIEQYLDGVYPIPDGMSDLPLASGKHVGCIIDHAAGRNRYIGYLISLSKHSFKPFCVALDCANGSAWMIAKSVFDALGASTQVIHAKPDGFNINQNAGSTHIEALAQFVKERHMNVGFAFDGDADRCMAVDEKGNIINGDHIMYLLAQEMKQTGTLPGNTVVTTVMSNLGLYRALEKAGIQNVQTQVGDKYVYERMQRDGYGIGGEQSGHIILSKYATTGDGILTAIKVMETMVSTKLPLSRLAEPVHMYPQVLKSIRVSNKTAVRENEQVQAKIARISKLLENKGRILLRESGTEPVVRVMVEAATADSCERYADAVIDTICACGLA